MAFTSIVLSDPATGASSVILPRDGVTAMELDVQPSVREVSDPVPGGDGTDDATALVDAAAVTLSLRLWPADSGLTPEALLDELAPLLAPWRRPVLVCGNDQWGGTRQLAVRFAGRTAVVDSPASLDVALSWKAPAGVWEAAATSSVTLNAALASTQGLHFTNAGAHFTNAGAHFVASTSASDSIVTVAGSMRRPWTALLYGPCTGPKLASDTTGQDLVFTDSLVLAAGEHVEIDTAARTANFLSDPAQPRLAYLDFANSSWWLLQPGANLVRYHPTSAGPATAAVLEFTPAWLA